MKLQSAEYRLDPIRTKTQRLRDEQKLVGDFWFRVNFRRTVLATAELLEASGQRVTTPAILRQMGVCRGNYRYFREYLRSSPELRLWKEYGFRENGFRHFQRAVGRLRNRKVSAISPFNLAKEAGVLPRAVWRYCLRNPQKALILGIEL